MKTNFDNPLELSSDHRTIFAAGPITWEQGDQHCHISVVLTQNNGAIQGSGDTGNYNPHDATWECTVDVTTPHNGQWNPGLAVHCVGTASPPPSSPWPPQDVSLQVQPAAAPA